jgi:hypothetical protein
MSASKLSRLENGAIGALCVGLLGCYLALEAFNLAVSGFIWLACLGRVPFREIYYATI